MLVIDEISSKHVTLGEEGIRASEIGLLESRLMNWLLEQEPELRTISNLNESFEKSESGPGIGLLKKLGVILERGLLILPEDIKSIQRTLEKEAYITRLSEGSNITSDIEWLPLFQSRKNIIEVNESIIRTWKLTDAGIKFDTNSLDETQQIVDLTPEMLQTDEWKNAEFKRYDVNLPAPTPQEEDRIQCNHSFRELDLFF